MSDLIALLLATLSGLLHSGVTQAQLQQKLATVIIQQQPAPIKDVKVVATGVTANGADKVEFHFTDLYMKPMMVEKSTFTCTGVQKGNDGKLSVKSITWSAGIDQDALTQGLESQGGKMGDATVTIEPDGLTLHGKWPLALGAKVSYNVTGNLSIEDVTQLVFHISKSDVVGVGVPRGINNKIEAQVNPVYDFAKFAKRSGKQIELARQKLNYNFNLLVQRVVPGNGKVVVYGSA